MARKLNKNLLALSSAAIVSIYAVGFARSATTSASVAPPTSASATTAIAQALATASTTASSAAATTTPATSAAATTSAAAASSRYKDGTFTGSGTSSKGNISVAVTVQGGQISAVQITGSTTHYPASRISQLPGEVVAAQGASIKLVSGATDSSQAFKQAVTQALAQAATAA